MTKDEWKKSYSGVVSTLYSAILWRSKKRGWGELSFTLEDFKVWFPLNGGADKYVAWAKADYKRGLKPSVDRMDVLGKYLFENMQVLTSQENKRKGDLEKEILWGKKIAQVDLSGNVIAVYSSAKFAAKYMGVDQDKINRCARTGHKTSGSYWKYLTDFKHAYSKSPLSQR